jgi:hypothetical protein
MSSPRRLARSVLAWPVETQQGSRRNAMIASTALTERRRERDEVEEFLAARALAAGATGTGTGRDSGGDADMALPARRDVI